MIYDTLKRSLTSRLTLIGDHTLSGTPGTSVAVQLPPPNPLMAADQTPTEVHLIYLHLDLSHQHKQPDDNKSTLCRLI